MSLLQTQTIFDWQVLIKKVGGWLELKFVRAYFPSTSFLEVLFVKRNQFCFADLKEALVVDAAFSNVSKAVDFIQFRTFKYDYKKAF